MTIPTYTAAILFTKAHRAVRTQVYAVLAKYDLKPTDWLIMTAALDAPDGVRLSSVAKSAGVKAPMVTMMVDNLAEKGLINRLPHHSDKRAKLLVITTEGKKLVRQIEKDLNRKMQRLLKGSTVEELSTFQRVLETIIHNNGE